jgi:hypothetical protein
VFLLVPVAGLAWAVTRPFGDNSFLWHVRAGTLQLDRGTVLTSDPFSIEFVGEGWRTQSWLADIMFGYLERATSGIGWVPTYMFVVAAATLVVTLVVTYSHTAHLGATAVAGTLLVWQAAAFANARPVIFSYLLVALLVAALRSDRTDWAVPPLIWLWAMLHGSFVMGIGLIVLEGIRRRSRRHIELAVVGGILATFTAHGVGIWVVLIEFVENRDALQLIQEWMPPNYGHPFMVPYAVLVMAAVYAASRGRIDRNDLVVVIPFLFFGLLAVRNLYPAMIVTLPYVANGIVPEKPETRRTESPIVVGAFVLVLLIGAAAGLARPVPLSEDSFPSEAALAVIDDGPLFHGGGPGGFFIYAQWPERSVVIDDRAELYGADYFREWGRLANGVGWRERFSELDISQALLKPDWPLAIALEEEGWIELFRDEAFVVVRAP